MSTLYIRDVPEEVAETLKERAAQAGQSLSAYVNAELARWAARPTNAEVVEKLRSLDRGEGPGIDAIVEVRDTSRR